MASVHSFTTSRLSAHRLEPDDFSLLDRMHQDPIVMETLGGVRSEGDTRVYLRRNLEHWDRYGYGLWIFRDRDDGSFVGRGAIRHLELAGKDEIEVEYALMRSYWGRGLATEITRAMARLAFLGLGIDDLVAVTLPGNAASRRVIEKVGGILEGEVIHADDLHVLYRFRQASIDSTSD